MSVVTARNLHVTIPSKSIPVKALAGVDLNISAGSLFVLLGPNGAGKTTFMRCITGLIQPTEGSISVFTIEKNRRENLSRLGILIENSGVYGRLNAFEYLSFFGSFFKIENLKARIYTCADELGLTLDQKPVAKLSQGNKQKLHLVRSLIHHPKLLLWDEPTDHLDPISQKQILRYLKRYLQESGATALVATHRLEQMESVASHFGFLAHGKLLKQGTREEILNPNKITRVKVGFELKGMDEADQEVMTKKILKTVEEVSRLIDFKMEKDAEDLNEMGSNYFFLRLELNPNFTSLTQIVKALVDKGLPVSLVETLQPTLSEVYSKWIPT